MHACQSERAAVVSVCGLEPVYNPCRVVVALETRRHRVQATGEAVWDDRSRWESKLTSIDLAEWEAILR